MGGSTQTSSSTSQPSNPMVGPTLDRLLAGIQNQYDKTPQGNWWGESLYVPAGTTTNQGWKMATDAAGNPNYASGVNQGITYNQVLSGQGGLQPGQQTNIDTVNGVTGGYGRIGSAAQNPSLTEQTLMDVASGKQLNQFDPAFQAALDRASNQTAADVQASIGASGRAGSNVNVNALTDAVGGLRTNAIVGELNNQRARQMQALGAIEGTRQQGVNNQLAALSGQAGTAGQAFGMQQQGIQNAWNAQSMLPQLFNAAQLPANVFRDVGAAQDANNNAAQQGRYDLWSRQTNAQTDQLAKLASILGGVAGAGGTTTSNEIPWWLAGLGIGSTAAGTLGKFFGM